MIAAGEPRLPLLATGTCRPASGFRIMSGCGGTVKLPRTTGWRPLLSSTVRWTP